MGLVGREKSYLPGSKKGGGEHWKLMTCLVLGNEAGEKQACRPLLLESCTVFGQVGAPIESEKEVEKLMRGSKKGQHAQSHSERERK